MAERFTGLDWSDQPRLSTAAHLLIASRLTGSPSAALAASCTARLPMVELSVWPISTGRWVRFSVNSVNSLLRLAPPRMWMRSSLRPSSVSRLRQCESIAVGEALEDHARKDRLIAGHVGNGRPTPAPQLVIDALRHVGVEQERLGVHVDCARKARSRSLRNEVFNLPRPPFGCSTRPCTASAATCR